jgi:hypothetical protein
MTKLAAVIQVPFRSANQFLGEGGLQVRGLSLLAVTDLELTRTLGRLLRHTRQDSCHCGSARQLGPYHRWLYRAAPAETARRDQGPHQGPRLLHVR